MAAAETWAAIPSAPGYEASTRGRIRSTDRVITYRNGAVRRYTGQILSSGSLRGAGHPTVSVAGKRKRYIHQLVLEAFVGPCPDGMEGCHKNGDKLDNRLVNLRWDTRSENQRDVVRHGAHWKSNLADCARGHALAAPNLTRSSVKRGHRTCLACTRASARRNYWLERGVDLDLQQLADSYYAEIRSGAAA